MFNPPSPKTKLVDVPGADWHLDLSTVLTGDIAYNAREGSLEFIVDNGQYSDYKAETWATHYSKILDYLHGKVLNATLEDDPGFYYTGRFAINEWRSDPENSKIVIDYNVSPFKHEAASSLEDWVWDTFNFETGIVREYKDLTVDGSLTFIIVGRRMHASPTFIVKSTDKKGMTVTFNGSTYKLPDGTSRVVNIVTSEGDNKFVFKGNGMVSIDYRGGCL